MRMNRWILLSIAAVIIICTVKVYAGSLSMTTYYPAPTGYYDNVKVNKGLTIPCYKQISAQPSTAGSIWVVDPTNVVAQCN